MVAVPLRLDKRRAKKFLERPDSVLRKGVAYRYKDNMGMNMATRRNIKRIATATMTNLAIDE